MGIRVRGERERGQAHLSLQVPHQQAIQYLSCLVAVSHILEGFRCVLAADVEEDFFSTPAVDYSQQLWSESIARPKVSVPVCSSMLRHVKG